MRKLGYVPALDGLRGVAILLVLVDHVGGWAQGGRGVDLFFVLSGFLITTLLLEERETAGRVDLPAFYARRARRLLPALAVFLAVYLVVAAALGLDGLPTVARYGFYTGNFAAALDAHGVDYGSLTSYGLAHLWSLATEEQFYLLWPLMLLLLVRAKRPLLAIGMVVFAAETVRFLLAAHGAAPTQLYYLPYGHSQGLVVGGAVATYRFRRGGHVGETAAGCLFALAAITVILSGTHGDAGFFVVRLPVVELVFAGLVLAAVAENGLREALSARALVLVGKISYSLYLWHFMFVLVLPGRQFVVLAASFGCAVVSWKWVEQPFRRSSHQLALRCGVRAAATSWPVAPETGAVTPRR